MVNFSIAFRKVYYTSIMENISAGTSIPVAILRGAQAGQLAGSEVNEREYFKLISDCQSRYEPGIMDLIDRLMETKQIPDVHYRINWLAVLRLTLGIRLLLSWTGSER